MKINELLMSIRNKEFDLEKRLEVKKYLPIEVKKTIAQAIIYECTTTDMGAIKVDSVARYMSYVRYMITTHTNLEYTDEDYDRLCSTEYKETTLLNAIMDCFGSDAQECTRILGLMMDDYMQTTTIEFTVAKFLAELSTTINGLASGLQQLVDNTDTKSILPEGIDVEKINKFLNKYVK